MHVDIYVYLQISTIFIRVNPVKFPDVFAGKVLKTNQARHSPRDAWRSPTPESTQPLPLTDWISRPMPLMKVRIWSHAVTVKGRLETVAEFNSPQPCMRLFAVNRILPMNKWDSRQSPFSAAVGYAVPVSGRMESTDLSSRPESSDTRTSLLLLSLLRCHSAVAELCHWLQSVVGQTSKLLQATLPRLFHPRSGDPKNRGAPPVLMPAAGRVSQTSVERLTFGPGREDCVWILPNVELASYDPEQLFMGWGWSPTWLGQLGPSFQVISLRLSLSHSSFPSQPSWIWIDHTVYNVLGV